MTDSPKPKLPRQSSSDPGTYDLEPNSPQPKEKSSPQKVTEPEPPPEEPESFWNSLLKKHRPLEKETSFFILVSALDVFMTWMLLRRQTVGFSYQESNAVAKFFIDHWGIRGMVYFKFFMVAFVCIITQIIAVKKEKTALYVLNFAIIVVGCVVIYSLSLLLRYG